MDDDAAIARAAAAIGELARTRILCCLMDGRERTSTELATVADVSPSTTSVHLDRLKSANLVKVLVRGRFRFYRLNGPDVANALEALSTVAGCFRDKPSPSIPNRLRAARTCYDHMAGALAVSLHDRFRTLGWLAARSKAGDNAYDVRPAGVQAFETLGIDVESIRALRRRFACACLDWSEQRPHLGGALGAALLTVALKRKWVLRDLDSRALGVTSLGRREMLTLFDLHV
jgi:DNA-binding transcriptional ArsR family regulator